MTSGWIEPPPEPPKGRAIPDPLAPSNLARRVSQRIVNAFRTPAGLLAAALIVLILLVLIF